MNNTERNCPKRKNVSFARYDEQVATEANERAMQEAKLADRISKLCEVKEGGDC